MGLREDIKNSLGELALDFMECQGDLNVIVSKDNIVTVLTKLRDDLGFDFLSDVLGVDNSAFYEKLAKAKKKKKKDDEPEEDKPQGPPPPRFEVVYLLLSLETNKRMAVKIQVPEDDAVVDSVTCLWKSADWPEREIYDMFGISFKGHHNLKRLLMWDEFPAYPLRKDYPLEGQGEERIMEYND